MFDRVVGLTHLNLNRMALGSETWGQQFRTAMTVNGGDIENASSMDYFMHFVTFPWKVSPQKGIVFLARLSYCSILYQTGQRSSSFYVGYFSSSSPRLTHNTLFFAPYELYFSSTDYLCHLSTLYVVWWMAGILYCLGNDWSSHSNSR